MGYYGKEKEPKGVTASDRSGEKMGSEKGQTAQREHPA